MILRELERRRDAFLSRALTRCPVGLAPCERAELRRVADAISEIDRLIVNGILEREETRIAQLYATLERATA